MLIERYRHRFFVFGTAFLYKENPVFIGSVRIENAAAIGSCRFFTYILLFLLNVDKIFNVRGLS